MIEITIEDFKKAKSDSALVDKQQYKVISTYDKGVAVVFEMITHVAPRVELIREISYSAFRERFNPESKLAIETALVNNPLVRFLEKDLQARGIDKKPIRLDSPDLAFGLNEYDKAGLLVSGLTIAKLLRNGTNDEVL